jgi:ribosomal-protein-alanine N-acetyltransferase
VSPFVETTGTDFGRIDLVPEPIEASDASMEDPKSPAGVIRKLTPQDAEEVTRLLVGNRERHRPFVPLRSDEFFTVDAQRERLTGSDHVYGILDADALAGTITLSNLVGDPFRSATVGYWVDDARRGRGLATRALAAIAEVAFGALELHRLEAATLVENAASQRVLEKNRFVRIGLAPHYLRIAGVWRDHVLFQRTIED